MEIVRHPTLPSEVIVSKRVHPTDEVEQKVVAAVVKATFDIDTGQLVDDHRQYPIWVRDEPFDNDDEKFRFEHDLAPYKPCADVVILGERPAFGDSDDSWKESVQLGGEEATVESGDGSSDVYVFGWADRRRGLRQDWMGDEDELEDNPNQLPDGFDNRFFNAGPYDDGDEPVFDHQDLSGASIVTWESWNNTTDDDPEKTREYALPAGTPRCVVSMSGVADRNVQMNLDTLIVEPAGDVFVTVWRGVTPFDAELIESADKLELSGDVTAEGEN